jgi:catechol 2,3-dioxygenase-like lactoylglutathione lyase family enzyme
MSLAAAADSPVTRLAGGRFKIADLDKARQFYTGSLGLEEAFDLKDSSGAVKTAYFKINDEQYLEFAPGSAAEFSLQYVTLLTPDLKRTLELLHQRGFRTGEIGASDDGADAFTMRDPNQTELRFVTYAPGSQQAVYRGKALGARRIVEHLQHVGLPADNEAAAMGLYRDALGFREFLRGGPSPGEIRWINMNMPATPGDIAELMVLASQPAQMRRHICFETADIQRTYKQLLERGVTANFKPFAGQNNRWIMFLRDPNGIRVEFMGEKVKN